MHRYTFLSFLHIYTHILPGFLIVIAYFLYLYTYFSEFHINFPHISYKSPILRIFPYYSLQFPIYFPAYPFSHPIIVFDLLLYAPLPTYKSSWSSMCESPAPL